MMASDPARVLPGAAGALSKAFAQPPAASASARAAGHAIGDFVEDSDDELDAPKRLQRLASLTWLQVRPGCARLFGAVP